MNILQRITGFYLPAMAKCFKYPASLVTRTLEPHCDTAIRLRPSDRYHSGDSRCSLDEQ